MRWIPAMLVGASSLAAACTTGPSRESLRVDEQLRSDLMLIGGARVYFGHQSVGGNIVAGLQDLTREVGAGPAIVELRRDAAPRGPVFLHSEIGENGRPLTKLAGFAEHLEALAPDDVDVAAMKFCYLDFRRADDPSVLLAEYAARIAELRRRFPRTAFLHITAPLKAPEGVKGVLKRLVGYADPVDENIRRNQFNALLRKRFASEPLFDLASVESTSSDGERSVFRADGAIYEQLVPDYTTDGGHLNSYGRQLAARALITSLARVLRCSSPVPQASTPASHPPTDCR
jgi:hypothetical protein